MAKSYRFKEERKMGIKGFKAFDKDLKCRDFQYEVGKIYKEDVTPSCCNRGFHFCEYPLETFRYYNPNESRFCEVEALGDVDKEDGDTKVATNKIKIGAEITIAGLVKAAIEKKVKGSTVRKEEEASSATGNEGASSATGDYGASSATGDYGASSATGYRGASSAGNETAIAVAWGYKAKASGVKGSYIVCAEWENVSGRWELKGAKMIKVDGKKIKENTFYRLVDGKFVEAEND